jgi:hypothetical protein
MEGQNLLQCFLECCKGFAYQVDSHSPLIVKSSNYELNISFYFSSASLYHLSRDEAENHGQAQAQVHDKSVTDHQRR